MESSDDAFKASGSTGTGDVVVDLLALKLQGAQEEQKEEEKLKSVIDDIKAEAIVQRSHLDEVLVEALRTPRDRVFILRQEKDMEERIRSGREVEWELPLMNSYQRLLVHRIADHFHLAHSIDAVTKAVTLTRQQDTCIPELSISTMAITDVERLSEPVYSMRGDNDGSGNTSFGAFKIMRREGAGRSGSSRNGSGSGEAGAKDRRNMTIEEREAAYKEARQRIFGSEEASVDASGDPSTMTPVSEVDIKSLEGESSSSKSVSRKSTPGRLSPAPSSTSSTSSTAFLRAGAPSFDPNLRGGPSAEAQWQQQQQQQQQQAYLMIDNNGQQYHHYSGGYVWPVLQLDVNGRQVISNANTPLVSPSYQFTTPGSSGSNQDFNSSLGPNSSISSRSTSISAGAESENAQGSRSVTHDQSYAASVGGGGGNEISRAQSVSPSIPFHRNVSSNSMSQGRPGGGGGGGTTSNNTNGMMASSHVYQGQVPIPASWHNNFQQYQHAMQQYNNGMNVNNLRPYPTQNSPMGNLEQQPQRVAYAAAAQEPSRGSPMPSSSNGSSQSSGSGPAYLNPALTNQRGDDVLYHSNSLGSGRERGRISQTDRTLFDPNKPTITANSSSGTSGRLSLGKSASAGGKLESRPSSASDQGGKGLDSEERSPATPSSRPSSEASRQFTPPSHPSLPARPDWVLQAKINKMVNEKMIEEEAAGNLPPPP
ncbi:hypothetical protein CBS101457_006806 [Exobasidium rhododendri]|nr:hypothetical protein CBS101457_006806 [Exobasidium rhododendri]